MRVAEGTKPGTLFCRFFPISCSEEESQETSTSGRAFIALLDSYARAHDPERAEPELAALPRLLYCSTVFSVHSPPNCENGHNCNENIP